MPRRRSILLALLPALLAGCGGSGSHHSSSNSDTDTTARVGPQVTIDWPARARSFAAPDGAAYVTVTVPGGGASGADAVATLARPAGTAAVSTTYTVPIAVQPGLRLLRLDFYATNPAQGFGSSFASLANTTVNVKVLNDGTLRTLDDKPLGAVGFASNVASVALATGQSVEVGGSADLGLSAVTAAGALVALPPGAATFRIASGGEFLRLQPDGSVSGIAPGTATIVPTLGGLSGEPVALVVLPAPVAARSVALATSDLVVDPTRSLLYAALPPTAVNGNSVVSLDGTTGALGAPIRVGSDPSTLAISDDGTTLYVGLRGANAVRRVDLVAGVAGPTHELPVDSSFNGPSFAASLAVQPGNPSVYAAATQSIYGTFLGITVFDDGVARPNRVTDFGVGRFVWNGPDRIAAYSGFSNGGIVDVAVDVQGASRTRTVTNNESGRLVAAGDRLYDASGGVFDAATFDRLGTLPLTGTIQSGSTTYGFAVDPVAKRAYSVEIGSGSSIARLHVYDTETFVQLSVRRIVNINVPAFGLSNGDATVLRVGADGLVVRLSDQLVFIDGLASL